MSVIVTELYDALISAGAPEAQARAAAAAIPLPDDLATRQGLLELKSDLAAVKADVAAVKAEVALLKYVTFTFFPVVIGLLVKIAFFPG